MVGVRYAVILLSFAAALLAQPIPVKIEKHGGGFRLMRGGKPYEIKGAVGGVRLDQLVAAGGNSTRTGPDRLDEAQRFGLTALVGLPLGKQRMGFDYSDQAQVAKQREQIRAIVEKWKHHPAVLIWAIGNEPELITTEQQRRELWKEVNYLAAMIKSLDPNHPVITVIGGEYREMLHEVREQCPELDAMGLNSYKDMLTLPEDVAKQGWDKAYLITEFGPVGHWQVPKTSWKMPLEQTSSEKAQFYEQAYRHAVLNQPACLGAYVFHWSQHQEKTHTWYGMFLEDGSRTEAIDVMTRLWSGRYPQNRCPRVSPISANTAATLAPGSEVRCEVSATDPDGDRLDISWEIRPDVADNPNTGGDPEPPVRPIPGSVVRQEGSNATLRLPASPGNYRIFVFVRDGQGNAATANLPVRAVE